MFLYLFIVLIKKNTTCFLLAFRWGKKKIGPNQEGTYNFSTQIVTYLWVKFSLNFLVVTLSDKEKLMLWKEQCPTRLKPQNLEIGQKPHVLKWRKVNRKWKKYNS